VLLLWSGTVEFRAKTSANSSRRMPRPIPQTTCNLYPITNLGIGRRIKDRNCSFDLWKKLFQARLRRPLSTYSQSYLGNSVVNTVQKQQEIRDSQPQASLKESIGPLHMEPNLVFMLYAGEQASNARLCRRDSKFVFVSSR
jgi:hypothetical protein